MRMIVTLGAVLALVGCASGPTPQSATTTSTRTATVSRSTIITSPEIQASGATSLEDLVRKTRPTWGAYTAIYINEAPFAGVARDIDVKGVREVRYLSASEAQMKWGSRVREVIQVIR